MAKVVEDPEILKKLNTRKTIINSKFDVLAPQLKMVEANPNTWFKLEGVGGRPTVAKALNKLGHKKLGKTRVEKWIIKRLEINGEYVIFAKYSP